MQPGVLPLRITWVLPYRQAYEAALPKLLSRERTIEFLEPLRTYVKDKKLDSDPADASR